MDLDLVFLGTGGSVPTARRATASLLVRRGGDRPLFDCGEGTQRQMHRSVGLVQLDEIYLTHFHADHYLGIPGLLGYRAANTLDAMVGHHNDRYERFGWAAARFDDLVNLPGSRIAGAATPNN